MQNANLLNLPENYTFKYCACTCAASAASYEWLCGKGSGRTGARR